MENTKIPRYLNNCEQCALWVCVFGFMYNIIILAIYFYDNYAITIYLFGNGILFISQLLMVHFDIIGWLQKYERYKRDIVIGSIVLGWTLYGCIIIGLTNSSSININVYIAVIISIVMSSFGVFSISGGYWRCGKKIENRSEVEKIINERVKIALDAAMIEMATRLERGDPL